MTAEQFPATVDHEGRKYYRTGKTGTRVADGVPTAEYEDEDGWRVWLGTDGKVMPD